MTVAAEIEMQPVVTALLTNAQDIYVPMLPGARVMLHPGADDETLAYYGLVTDVRQWGEWVRIDFDDGDTAVVSVEDALVTVLEEADPETAYRLWLEARHREMVAYAAQG